MPQIVVNALMNCDLLVVCHCMHQLITSVCL